MSGGRAIQLVLALALCSLGACIPLDQNSCRTDQGCASGEVCTDVDECALSENAPNWRVSWTINGEAPSETNCALVTDMSLTISSSQDQRSYAPIACELSTFSFGALPRDYDTARLEARNENGGTLAQARGTGERNTGSELVLNLSL